MTLQEISHDAALYEAVLDRRNINWTPDESTVRDIRAAMEEAADYLRKVAGNPELDFGVGELRGLFVICTWYFVENLRAEFAREYSGELIALRLEEGFGCGKEQSDQV